MRTWKPIHLTQVRGEVSWGQASPRSKPSNGSPPTPPWPASAARITQGNSRSPHRCATEPSSGRPTSFGSSVLVLSCQHKGRKVRSRGTCHLSTGSARRWQLHSVSHRHSPTFPPSHWSPLPPALIFGGTRPSRRVMNLLFPSLSLPFFLSPSLSWGGHRRQLSRS